jgi:hypothetical protein
MVAPVAFVTHSQQSCIVNLPPDAQNLLGSLLFCSPYGDFGLEGEKNQQPYLVWEFTETCLAGSGTPDPCHDYAYWLSLAEAEGAQVGFDIFDYSNASVDLTTWPSIPSTVNNQDGYVKWVVSAPNLLVFALPPNGCVGERTVYVQMWYRQGDEKLSSPTSNLVSIPCPLSLSDSIKVEISFTNLTLSGVDDNDGGTQDVEVYGYFHVNSPSSLGGAETLLQIGTWNAQDSDCPDDIFAIYLQSMGAAPGCPPTLTDGAHPLSDYYMCQANIIPNWLGSDCYSANNALGIYFYSPGGGTFDSWQKGNNKLRIRVSDGDALHLVVKLVDWDDLSGNDLVCFAHHTLSSRSISEWSTIDSSFPLTGFGDPNTCRVDLVINAP